jgi:ABC-2 type transport system permease protein
MALMVIKRLRYYLRILWLNTKFSGMWYLQFRVSLTIGILVELAYHAVLLAFFQIVYANVPSLGGLTYMEMLFFTGVVIVISEFWSSFVFADGIRTLPEIIKDGGLDILLLKPVHSLFYVSFRHPYLPGFLSALPGFFLIGYALTQLQFEWNILHVLASLFILICGMIISYSVMVLISSLTFVFINAESLPRFAANITFEFGQYPHKIYTGFVEKIFTFIIPIIFIFSVPATTFLHGPELQYLIIAPILAVLFLSVTIFTWNRLIRNYTSASS